MGLRRSQTLVNPIIIAMILVSAHAFGAETPHAPGRVEALIGCSENLLAELPSDRKVVLEKTKNLSNQLRLLSTLISKKELQAKLGSSIEELDESLARLATELLYQGKQPIKTEDLKEALASVDGRIKDALNPDQREIFISAEVAVVPEETTAAPSDKPAVNPDPYLYESHPGRHDPPRAKP